MIYFFFIALLASIMFLVLMPLYIYLKNNNYSKVLMLIVKGCITGTSMLLCIHGMKILSSVSERSFISSGFKGNWWVVLGIFTCMVGDIILELKFIAGGVIFFFGYVCYILFFLKLAPLSVISIPIFAVSIVLVLCYFYRFFVFLTIEKYLYGIYAINLITSLSIGILLPLNIGVYGLFPALAISLLIISDLLLVRNRLSDSTLLSNIIALSFYFFGQFTMAMSIYIPALLLHMDMI